MSPPLAAATATTAGIMGPLRRRPTVVGAKVPKKRVSSRVVVEIPANPERSPMSHTATFPLSPSSNEYLLDKYSPASAGADVNYFGIGAGMNKLWTSVFGAKDESSSTATTSGIAAAAAAAGASIETVPGHTMLAVQVKHLSGGGRLKKSQSSHELGASVDKVISPPTPTTTPVPTTPSAVTTELSGEASLADPVPVTVESPPIKAPEPVPEKEVERYAF